MILNIVGISRKPKTTQYGEKISVGLKTTEYGDKWLNGWQDEVNVNWQKGQAVEATVEQKGEWLNFKAIKPSVAPQAVGNVSTTLKQPYQAINAKQSDKTGFVAGRPDQSDEIRANVALKMVSEILAAGVVPINEWEQWANYFFNFKPNQSLADKKVGNLGLTPEQESEINLSEPPF